MLLLGISANTTLNAVLAVKFLITQNEELNDLDHTMYHVCFRHILMLRWIALKPMTKMARSRQTVIETTKLNHKIKRPYYSYHLNVQFSIGLTAFLHHVLNNIVASLYIWLNNAKRRHKRSVPQVIFSGGDFLSLRWNSPKFTLPLQAGLLQRHNNNTHLAKRALAFIIL